MWTGPDGLAVLPPFIDPVALVGPTQHYALGFSYSSYRDTVNATRRRSASVPQHRRHGQRDEGRHQWWPRRRVEAKPGGFPVQPAV